MRYEAATYVGASLFELLKNIIKFRVMYAFVVQTGPFLGCCGYLLEFFFVRCDQIAHVVHNAASLTRINVLQALFVIYILRE